MQISRYSCQMLINFELSQRIFEQFSNMKFHENPSKKKPSCSMRREGQTDTMNLAVAFAILQTSLKMNLNISYGVGMASWDIVP